MAEIIPFQAVRPTSDKVALVTTLAYEEYSATELASWLDFNPFSFLHIINPAFINQQKIDVHQRFKIVGSKYWDFKNNSVFTQENQPMMYLYSIEGKNYNFEGIMAATSVSDYLNNCIKPHENTLDYRVKMLKDYFETSGFNTEPVLMMHPEEETLNSWKENHKKNNDFLYQFSTTNKEKHTLWQINSDEDLNFLIQTFKKFNELYIADGHHRSAASALLYKENPLDEKRQFFMSYLVSESCVKINEYHRVVHDLNQLPKEEFLQKIESIFSISPREQQLWKPTKKFQYGMYLDGQYYCLELKNKPFDDSNNLDAQILYDTVLHPILGIEDLRTDSRIDYISGNKNLTEMFQQIDNGHYKVGFTLLPPTIEDIKYLAEHQLIMPPKSTYIEPKLRNGLLIYEY